MTEKFTSPSALREFALETAFELRAAGQPEACEVMEAAATFVTSSGWEWLGELGAAVATIRERFQVSDSIVARLSRIREAATSQQPYE
jgi:hypothetical protein